MPKVAVIQIAPVVLDRDKTIKLAVSEISKAAQVGAELVIFPEAFIPGYPAWIWRLRSGPVGVLHVLLILLPLVQPKGGKEK